MLAIRNWSFRSPISFAPRERRLLRVTINLPQLKRQRGPKCELFTSATEARNQWFIKAETSLEAGRRGGKEANYVSLFCAHSDQFIICRSRGFIHSILRFLPQPTPPSGSRRAGDNSRPGGKLQVAQKCFPAKGRGGKLLRWRTSEKGAPQRGPVQAGGRQTSESPRRQLAPVARAARTPPLPSSAPELEARGGGCGRGATGKGPGSPQLRGGIGLSPPCSPTLPPTPASAPSPSLSLALPAAEGFRCPTAVWPPSPRFSTPANEVWPAEAEPTSGLESLTFRLQASTCLQAGFPKEGGGGRRETGPNKTPTAISPKQEVTFWRLQINRHHQKEKARGGRKQRRPAARSPPVLTTPKGRAFRTG